MFDPDRNNVSVFTCPDESLEEPVKIRLSTISLGPTISRRFLDAGPITLATCSSAESAFLSGDNPPEISRSFFFFQPRHPPAKVSKNRVVWLESFAPTEQDSISGLRTTKCFVKKMKKLVSGTVIKIYKLRKIDKDEPSPIVDYVTSAGKVYKVRQNFVDVLNGMPLPLSEVIEGLMEYENNRSIYRKSFLCEPFVNYLKGKPSPFLWSMLQWSACFGDDYVMRTLSLELATRVNTQIKNGLVAVQMELGVGV